MSNLLTINETDYVLRGKTYSFLTKREDVEKIVYADGSAAYAKGSLLHREDGPAVEGFGDNSNGYFLHGFPIAKAKFEEWARKRKFFNPNAPCYSNPSKMSNENLEEKAVAKE